MEKCCCGPGCTEGGKLICSRCGAARYCSAACQKAHWKLHKPACIEPPPPALPAAVEAAVQRLNASALTAALGPLLAPAPGAAGGGAPGPSPRPLARSALVAAAVAAFEKNLRAEMCAGRLGVFQPAPSPSEKSCYLGLDFLAPPLEEQLLLPVLRVLLAHGAPPHGLVPRSRAPDCNAPVEVVLARMHCDAALALLAGAGSRLDGTCTGVLEGLCDSECCVVRARMENLTTFLRELRSEHFSAAPRAHVHTEMIANWASPEPLRALLAAGAGGVLVCCPFLGQPHSRRHRITAASAALVEAVLSADTCVPQSHRAAEALLGAGVSPDFTLWVPRVGKWDPSALIPQESTLLSYVLEEACNEAMGLGLDAPDTTAPTRANRLAARARALRTEGPCHTVLHAVLAGGVEKSLRFTSISVLSGVGKDVFTHAAQMGVTHVVEAILGAGGDPNVGDPLLLAAHPYETPLECAVGWGHCAVVQALLRGGARVTTRAQASAGERGDAASAALMLAAAGGGGGGGGGAGAGATAAGQPHPLMQTCRYPAAYVGKTPLMLACLSGAAHVVREMLRVCPQAATAKSSFGVEEEEEEEGADCDCPLTPRTPMACALLSGGAPELVGQLVEAGARAPVLKGSVWVSHCGRQRQDLEVLRASRGWLLGREGLAATIGCDGCGSLPAVGAPAWHACGECASVRYCGEACQRSDWREHKVLCKELRKRPQPSA